MKKMILKMKMKNAIKYSKVASMHSVSQDASSIHSGLQDNSSMHSGFPNVSIKHTGSQVISTPPVDIIVRRHQIEVHDHGIGIPAADLPHIFEPFYRASNAMPAQGHGIGLALSEAIVSQLGGKLTVSSRDDEGTVFIAKFGSSSF